MTAFFRAGRTAPVTGTNTGIGQAIAVALGRAGAAAICAGRPSCAETVGTIDDAPVDIPVDNAGAAVFLASPAAKYIHGSILNDDGGWLAR